ncbi:MAG: PKD domain-containing protein, partial [Pirellulales bacterium]
GVDGPVVYPVKLRVQTDLNGDLIIDQTAEDTSTVTVVNVAPTAVLSNGGAVNEGSTGSVSFSGQFDPSPDDTTAGFHYSYDFNDDGVWEVGDGSYGGSVVADNQVVPASFLADGAANYTVKARILDDDGGFTDYTTVIAVNNVAPTLTISGAASTNENAVYTLSLSSSDPGTDTITSWTIDWGDGSEVVAGNPSSATHTYADGTVNYTVSATATDEDGTFSSNSISVTVANVAPTLTISGAANVDEGGVYTLNLSSSDPGTDTITSWTIDWGDGSEVVAGNPSSATHTYADGTVNYTVSATATDEDGTFSSNSISVAVANVAPTLTISGAASVDEGGVYTLNLSSSDPGTDTITSWTINWGDGSEFVSGNPSSVTHTYADGTVSYTVSATATDEDGTFGSNSISVTVNNLAPTADTGGPYTVGEGGTVTLSGSGTDPAGAADPLTFAWDLDDNGSFETSGASPTFSAAGLDGPTSRTIHLQVSDGDGGVTTATTTVSVVNVAPTADAGGPYLTFDDTPIALAGSGSDPAGALDPLSFAWDLDGDNVFGETGGAATRGDEIGASPTFDPTGLSTGSYTVELRVSDGDGGVTTDTATVNVLTAGTLLIDGTLYIVGTDSCDIVLISKCNNTIYVCATFNDSNPATFNSADVSDIQVRMRGGHDIVLTTGNVLQSMTIDGGSGNDLLTGGGGQNLIQGGSGHDFLYGAGGDDVLLGGTGNDFLSGGSGNDVLVGGDGDDVLKGGSGRDLIIGSQDNDWLEGGGDEDILIGGYTVHDNDLAALDAVMAVWTSSASFAARVNTLKGSGGLLQGGVAVFDDDDGDYINGGSGRDLIFGDTYLWDGAIDLIALQSAQDVLVAVN